MVLGGKCKNAADQVLSQKFMWLGCFVWSTRQVLEEQEVLSLDQWNCSGYESCHPFFFFTDFCCCFCIVQIPVLHSSITYQTRTP